MGAVFARNVHGSELCHRFGHCIDGSPDLRQLHQFGIRAEDMGITLHHAPQPFIDPVRQIPVVSVLCVGYDALDDPNLRVVPDDGRGVTDGNYGHDSPVYGDRHPCFFLSYHVSFECYRGCASRTHSSPALNYVQACLLLSLVGQGNQFLWKRVTSPVAVHSQARWRRWAIP